MLLFSAVLCCTTTLFILPCDAMTHHAMVCHATSCHAMLQAVLQ